MVTRNIVTASKLIETIERNLFERYGDVQAFTLNSAASNPKNWNNPTKDNPLIQAMNGYMTGYGIYDLMVLADPNGKLLAVNTVNAQGVKIPTQQAYNISFANEDWLKNALSGQFLKGKHGFTGTVVENVHRHPLIDSIYRKESYVLTFAAPVKDASGKIVAVWANFADFGLVEDIVGTFYQDYAEDGQKETELTILDKQGNILVDYDPNASNSKKYVRDFKVLGQVNLSKLGVQAAQAAVKKDAHGGIVFSWHVRKKN